MVVPKKHMMDSQWNKVKKKRRPSHRGGLERDAFTSDLSRRVLAYPRFAEGVLHPPDLQPAVVHAQPDVLQP